MYAQYAPLVSLPRRADEDGLISGRANRKNAESSISSLDSASCSGGGGIRTHGTLRHNGFQDRRIRPLCHPSVRFRGREGRRAARPQPQRYGPPRPNPNSRTRSAGIPPSEFLRSESAGTLPTERTCADALTSTSAASSLSPDETSRTRRCPLDLTDRTLCRSPRANQPRPHPERPFDDRARSRHQPAAPRMERPLRRRSCLRRDGPRRTSNRRSKWAWPITCAEIDAIADNPAAPTFENTIVALEGAGQPLDRVFTYYGIWSSNRSSPEFREIQQRMAPKLSEYGSKITQNERLFEPRRVRLRAQRARPRPPARQKSPRRARLRRLRPQRRHARRRGEGALRRDQPAPRRAAHALRQQRPRRRGGLRPLPHRGPALGPAGVVRQGRRRSGRGARTTRASTPSRTRARRWTPSSPTPTSAPSASRSGARTTTAATTATSTTTTRSSPRSSSSATSASASSATTTTRSGGSKTAWRRRPSARCELLEAVWPAAVARVEEEVADMQAIADAEGAGHRASRRGTTATTPRKSGRTKYDLDSDEVKQYLQLDKLREAMFYVAGELFGFEFTPVPDGTVPVFHEDVKVWEVTDRDIGRRTSGCGTSTRSRAPGKRSRRVGDDLPQPHDLRRREDRPRLEQLELRQGRAGRAGARLVGRRRDVLPRVRPRAPLPLVERRLPDAQRRRARLHRVPVAAPRTLAASPTP